MFKQIHYVALAWVQLLLLNSGAAAAQENTKFAVGLHYGYGSEIRNTDYTFTNRFIKGQLYYSFATYGSVGFEILLQPEVNFGEHQLLNLYFVTPAESNYEVKRDRFTKLKDVREYALNIGFLVRKPLSNAWSIYALASVGPLLTDTETERLSKGFAFADLFALGLTYKTKKTAFDVRPSLRHTSNAGLQSSNAGFNTINVEVGVSVPF